MYAKLMILSISLALFAQPCQDPASSDGESFKPDEGTYSGAFTYTGRGGSGKKISGTITFTIQGNEAKCGIAIISADDRDSYGGSAKDAGFIVTKK